MENMIKSEQNVKSILGKIFNWKTFGSVLAVTTILGSFNYNPGGVSTRVKMPGFEQSWVKEEGYYLTMPFLTRTSEWNQKGTIAATDNHDLVQAASLVASPRPLQFADSYEMNIEWSMRYEIPTDDIGLEEMYKSLKSQDNLLGNTLMPFAQTLVNDSVNQMLGGDFAQGGRNALRTLIDNQSQLGMYQTKVTKVKQVREAGKGTNNVTGGTTNSDIEITKVVYLEDGTGKRLRTPLAISQYGVKIVPNSISIVETKPVGRLVNYIKNKQDNIADQIKEDEKQKLISKRAKTAQLQGEENLVTRTNALNVKKQEAIIAAEQRVAEAKLQADKEKVERQKIADLAVIDKNRELQIAEANEGIQKANATAAKFEAQAIKETGLAEAVVTKAKYNALAQNKEVYLAEIQRDISTVMYNNLPNFKVEMPTNYIGGNTGSDLGSNLDVITGFGALGMMDKATNLK